MKFVVLYVALAGANPSPEPSLEVARAAYEEYVSTLQSVKVESRTWFKIDGRGVSEREMEKYPPRYFTEWCGPEPSLWARQGQMRVLSTQFDISPIDPVFGRPTMFLSFDGIRGYQATYTIGNTAERREFATTLQLPAPYHDIVSPENMLGLSLYQSQTPLLQCLANQRAQWLGMESISGHSCWKVDLGLIESRIPVEVQAFCWLDSKFGYLPRKIEQRFKLPNVNRVATFEVTEFSQVDDPLLGRKRNFPAKFIAYRGATDYRIEIDRVQINEVLPQAVFQPELLLGTILTELPIIPRQPARISIVGGSTELDKVIKERIEQSKQVQDLETKSKYPVAASASLRFAGDTEGVWKNWKYWCAGFSLLTTVLLIARWRFTRV